VAILPGYHVNSDKPKDEFLIPFQLTWKAGPLKAGAVSYPPPQDVQVGSDLLRVFTGSFDLGTEFSAPRDTAAGSVVMTGKLHYQACNDRMCFRPVTVDIHVPVLIE
jgi:thiol:disulfide interchange protein DsbD